ncbi:MAG: LUD domain-containing protein [Bacteroidetes bacterium]|nr:LUD domain-containing protein [Bacteroidota bacterium]
MTTREKILKAVLENQPASTPPPEVFFFPQETGNLSDKFADTLISIGGRAIVVQGLDAIGPLLPKYFDTTRRIATNIPELAGTAGLISQDVDPHSFQDIEVMLMRAHFGIAENGAVWITEQLMGQRILPFIPQHLAVVISASDIVPTMQQAYQRIGSARYRFGSFIAGPSKTADIEQALVLGAHGPRTMTAFIVH